jgi:hypothetical protein
LPVILSYPKIVNDVQSTQILDPLPGHVGWISVFAARDDQRGRPCRKALSHKWLQPVLRISIDSTPAKRYLPRLQSPADTLKIANTSDNQNIGRDTLDLVFSAALAYTLKDSHI